MTFRELDGLPQWVLQALDDQSFVRMTPVQAAVIPQFLKAKDVVVQAITGSGKTLAYILPLLARLASIPPLDPSTSTSRPSIRAIILSPTRELSLQIHAVLSSFLSSTYQSHIPPPLLLVGGTDIKDDVKLSEERQSWIVVGTPGRVVEFICGSESSSRKKTVKKLGIGYANVKEFEMLILDEADRLLDLGFKAALTRLLAHLPKQRRTGLFSATMSEAFDELARVSLRNPVRITVESTMKSSGKKLIESNVPLSLKNKYVVCHRKLPTLFHFFKLYQHKKTIVYFPTCATVDYYYRLFTSLPSSIVTVTDRFYSLHSHLSANVRKQNLSAFSASSSAILLCTDVGSRGLDVPDVEIVIQVEPPQEVKAFEHRVGRTARMGKGGEAIVLLREGREEEYIQFMHVRKVPLERDNPEIENEDEIWEAVRDTIVKDRDLHDRAIKAFVSSVQAYKKHEASYIFSLQHLRFGDLAKDYGLLRLPKMPELKGRDPLSEGWIETNFDFDTYVYKDPMREKKRLELLNLTSKTRNDGRKKRKHEETESWSKQKQRKERKKVRLSKKGQAIEAVKDQKEELKASKKEEELEEELEIDEVSEEEEIEKKRRKVNNTVLVGDFSGLVASNE